MQPLDELPLGQIRAVVERRLQEFADASGDDPEAIWQTALTAQTIPYRFMSSDEGEDLWASFTQLRQKEAQEITNQLA
jgi:hypothetical protein